VRRAALAAALGLLLLAKPTAAGDPPPPSPSARPADAARRAAIEAGCRWLEKKQNYRPGPGNFGANKATVAITALSALALMAGGSGVGRGPHGENVTAAVEFLLELVERPERRPAPPDGYFAYLNDGDSRMHGQGYATLALASALGTADARLAARIRAVLRRAVACCERSQTGTGGWGYEPDPAGDHEGSVTVTVAQGLRASRDAGIHVNADTVKRGLGYLRRSQRLEDRRLRGEDGGFKYSLTTETSTYALTAAALSSFLLFGEYSDADDPQERLRRGVAYLLREMRPRGGRPRWFYYGNFYAAWVGWQLGTGGSPGTETLWPAWQRVVLPQLLEDQRSDGSWFDEGDQHNFDDVLPTAFAILTLAIPDEQIPIFQR
jgi:hypothetical protein